MEARPGRHVDLKVGVVHAVQPPKGRDGMEQHVLQVDGEIERHHGEQHAGPWRQIEYMEQAPSSCLGNQGEPDWPINWPINMMLFS
jgi:hypothetical protein